MKKIILSLIASMYVLTSVTPALGAARFDDSLLQSTQSIQNNIDRSFQSQNGMEWASWLRDFIIYFVNKILTPVIIAVWVMMAIIWLWDLLWSTKDDGAKKWFSYILRWALWIIIMVSANFLANTLVNWWVFVYDAQNQLVWSLTAQRIYQRLMFPFLKTFMALVIGILFILALIRTLSMLMSPSEDNAKKARTIIIRSAIWILVIIFSKQLIEAIFGLESQVASATATNLWDIWEWVLADKQLPFLYNVINYVIWFTWLFVLIIIIVQAVQLLTNPTSEDTQKKLRKNFIYVLIWLIIIGTAYVVTNLLIVK